MFMRWVLGIAPAYGRLIVPSDDTGPGKSPVVVLSYRYWERRFGADPRVIGQKLAVNGYPLQIVGVTRKGFGGLFNNQEADAFIPLTMFPVTTPSAKRVWNTTAMFWLVTLARLKPGISIQKAQADMDVLWAQAVEAVRDEAVRAKDNVRRYRRQQIRLVPAAHATSVERNEMADPLKALAISTLFVLLIACANIASLMLARATERQKELALRLAIGATRWRLIRQMLSEAMILAVGGGILGLILAYFGILALGRSTVLNPNIHLRLNLALISFSAVITLFTCVLFGLLPAVRAANTEPAQSLTGTQWGTQGRAQFKLFRALIAAQVALSLILMVGAGLFIRTLNNLDEVDMGFQAKHIAVFDIDPTNLGYQGNALRIFYDQLLEAARRVPGVHSASLSVMTPLDNYERGSSFSVEGYQPKSGEDLGALVNEVTSGYFKTLGIPLLLGRGFQPQDEPAMAPQHATVMAAMGRSSGSTNEVIVPGSRVCVIDESLARHIFASANPIGKHLSFGSRYNPKHALEIVGVAKDVHQFGVREEDPMGTIYEPSWSNGPGVRWLAVRFAGNESLIVTAIRRELGSIDPNVPVLNVRTMKEYVNDSLAQERLIAFLTGFFGILAVGLTAVGQYGVIAYAVARRTTEIGIRMAMGAQRSDVAYMILRDSMIPVVVGMAFGLLCAVALTRLVATMLYKVTPYDPVSTIIATGVIVIVSLLGVIIPVRRATKIEPMASLKYE